MEVHKCSSSVSVGGVVDEGVDVPEGEFDLEKCDAEFLFDGARIVSRAGSKEEALCGYREGLELIPSDGLPEGVVMSVQVELFVSLEAGVSPMDIWELFDDRLDMDESIVRCFEFTSDMVEYLDAPSEASHRVLVIGFDSEEYEGSYVSVVRGILEDEFDIGEW